VFAGVTVAAYAVPQVMGDAFVAGLPVVAGLWALAAAVVVVTVEQRWLRIWFEW
jgi:MFS superfamily sulfate permease-like transporter